MTRRSEERHGCTTWLSTTVHRQGPEVREYHGPGGQGPRRPTPHQRAGPPATARRATGGTGRWTRARWGAGRRHGCSPPPPSALGAALAGDPQGEGRRRDLEGDG